MREIHNVNQSRVLYTDTDSIIFCHPQGQNPLTVGQLLGQMSLEYQDADILEYICGGAKQYALCLKKGQQMDYVMKLRGVTLNDHNAQRFQYEHFKQMVLNPMQKQTFYFEYPRKFGPNPQSQLITKPMIKKYKTTCEKGTIDNNFIVFPYGYKNF